MIDLTETSIFERNKMMLIHDTHASRENSHLIDEMLLYDHEIGKYLEEAYYEASQLAVY